MKKIIAVVAGIVLGLTVVTVAEAGRNSGGIFTFTLSGAGPVVQTGQVISTTWANNSLTELQTAMTDSLSRSGLGGMTAGLKLIDGSAPGTPSVYFNSGLTTGLYYTTPASVPTLNLAAGGARALSATSAGISVPGATTLSGTLGVTGAISCGDITSSANITANDFFVGTGAIHKTTGNLPITVDEGEFTTYSTNGVRIENADTGAARFGQTSRYLFFSPAGPSTYFSPNQVVGGIDTPVVTTDAANKAYVDGPGSTSTPAWTALTVTGSSCSGSPAYTRVGGVVYWRGTISCASASGCTCTTSAAVGTGYRPASNLTWVRPSVYGSSPAIFSLTASTGVLSVGGASETWAIGMVGLTYPAEQ